MFFLRKLLFSYEDNAFPKKTMVCLTLAGASQPTHPARPYPAPPPTPPTYLHVRLVVGGGEPSSREAVPPSEASGSGGGRMGAGRMGAGRRGGRRGWGVGR